MLQICDHPNIVKLLDAYQIADNPNTFYLVMDPWAPYTLSTFLHQSDSQRHHVSPWFTQGSHKTESKIFKPGNPTDYNKSTYAYLAPEQVTSTGSTLRSDVWQLGCCFALILAVFRQGSAGCGQLWDSFENSDGDCSCNIALEAPAFMESFQMLCGHGSVSQLRVYRLTTAMLEIEPELRFNIKTVKMELADL